MAAAGEVLLLHIETVARHASQPLPPEHAGRWCTATVARVPDLAGQLVRAAVLADRRAGASWAQIGEGLGVSAEAARGRFGRPGRGSGAARGA